MHVVNPYLEKKMLFRVPFNSNLTLPYDVLNVILVRCRVAQKCTLKLTLDENSAENRQPTPKHVQFRMPTIITPFKVLNHSLQSKPSNFHSKV